MKSSKFNVRMGQLASLNSMATDQMSSIGHKRNGQDRMD